MCGLDVVLSTDGSSGSVDAESSPASNHFLRRRGPDAYSEYRVRGAHFQLDLAGAVLRLRGRETTRQPVLDDAGNVLLWNGEIFGGDICVNPGESDTKSLLHALSSTTDADVPALMQRVQGPWSFAYWRASSQTLWHGRDALGRRSLLHAIDGTRTLRLRSTAVTPEDESSEASWAWTDLPCGGIWSAQVVEDEIGGAHLKFDCHRTLAPSRPLLALPAMSALCNEGDEEASGQAAAARLLMALSDAVRRRVCDVPVEPSPAAWTTPGPEVSATSSAAVAVLFSGGIDCMVLARLADLHLPPGQPIDLINVAFGDLASEAPDRQSGRAGVRELRSLSQRRFNFIEVDVTLAEMQESRAHLVALLKPAATVMDLNIGAALWFGARAVGHVRRVAPTHLEDSLGGGSGCRYASMNVAWSVPTSTTAPPPALDVCVDFGCAPSDLDNTASCRIQVRPVSVSALEESPARDGRRSIAAGGCYRSGARVMLLGSGADEQLGGYGRHRTVFRKEGWEGLSNELHAERERLWLRNLGRDDRIISDWAREARHPYLDEQVMDAIGQTPLHYVCDLRRAPGDGDKLILRRLARMLGLRHASALQKRAIQFGTRIANKNVCGQAVLDDSVDLRQIVHPEAERDTNPEGAEARRGDAVLRESLSKKRGDWASARAADTILT